MRRALPNARLLAVLVGMALAGCTDTDPDKGTEPDAEGRGGAAVVVSGGGGATEEDAAEPEPEPELGCATDEDCDPLHPSCVAPGLCQQCVIDVHCAVWEQCVEGHCLPRLCTPGQGLCFGDLLMACGSGGTSWEPWICKPGLCDPAGCTGCAPGARLCDGATVVECDPQGQGFEPFTTCGAGTQCKGGACLDCLSEGVRSCKADKVVECQISGFQQVVEDCVAQGMRCSQGSCIDCPSESIACKGDLQICAGEEGNQGLQDCSDLGMMCYQGSCLPRCKDFDFKTGFEGTCDDGLCCLFEDGVLQLTGKNSCVSEGGKAAPWSVCQAPTCCQLPGGQVVALPVGECNAGTGQPLVEELCQQEVCCQAAPGVFATMSRASCYGGSGVPVRGEASMWCAEGACCATAGGELAEVEQAECAALGGTPVPAGACEGQVEVLSFAVDLALDPSEACPFVPRMVVPSSSSDEIAVFDLETLELVGEPWPTCDNPSRVVLQPDTDVLVACRGDGVVQKHNLDGALLWSFDLPGCEISRGVARGPDGRVYASCHSPGMVWELDPETGLSLGSPLILPSTAYGLAVDETGLYVAGGGVTRVDPDAWEIDWFQPLSYYGIATDGAGTVWVGGPMLSAVDAATGAVIGSWTTTSFVHGVTVGLGGFVWGAVPGMGGLVVWDPATATLDFHVLPVEGLGPKGVAVDTLGNAYSVNLNQGSVTRIAPGGKLDHFGQGDLHQPYAYNGDLTGFSAQCVASNSALWTSEPQDVGGVAAWLDLSWDDDLPEGSQLVVSYQLDADPAWHPVGSSGSVMAAIGQVARFRALLSSMGGEIAPHLEGLTVRYTLLDP